MFCPKCAAENPNEARYCRQCGVQMIKQPQPVSQVPTKNGEFFKWIGYIVVFLFIMGILSNC